MKEKTAVEWMFSNLPDYLRLSRAGVDVLQLSKQLHRAQVEQAWIDGMKSTALAPFDDEFYRIEAAKYYDEKYGK